MMLDTKKIKDNLIYILIGLGLLLILLSFNLIFENINTNDITGLNNDESKINKLVINEILTDNEGTNISSDGSLYDWIELYNGTNSDIDLTNYGLSDRDDGSIKWLFPKTILKSKEYLVVYLTSDKNVSSTDDLIANFSLKKNGGETLSLKSYKGKTIDAIKTVELKKNNSMARNSDGKWIVTDEVTPGFENSKSGREEFLHSKVQENGENYLSLNEVLPVNEGNIIFNESDLYGYVEIVNNSESVINLSDYYLSNDENILYKWRFPEYNLNPNEVYLVYTNGLGIDNNVSFYLKSKNGRVYLSNKNGVVDSLEYNDLTDGVSYIKVNDTWYLSSNISLGYLNTTDGKDMFQRNYDHMKSGLVINEIMSSNSTYLAQNGNQYYDWIELYNNSNQDILLSDYTITTNKDDLKMFKLPDVVLPANSYYVIMASGDSSLSNNNYVHADFKLSQGEGLFLYKSSKLVDSLFVYDVPKNYSYGRGDNYGHFYYSTATPKAKNSTDTIREIAYTPIFNIEGGIYNNVDNLEIKLTSAGDIYYTLDGSNPSNNSLKYTSPITITNTQVIKAISYENNKRSSEVVTKSYIVNENHTLPVMSISLNNSDLNYLNAKLYADRIVNAHVEFYEEDSFFTTSCGLKLFGGQSRQLDKKSFSLKFSNKYASSNLNYKVFDDKDIMEFGDLVIRSGSQDQTSSMIRDEFVSKILTDYTSLLAQSSKPTVLYINGNYHGIYYIKEKINEDFVQNNYNVSSSVNIVDHLLRTESGSNSEYIDLKNYILTHDMSSNDSYNYVSNILDIDNFIDSYVIEFIINDTDIHNVRFYNTSSIDNGKIKVILYDSDYSFFEDYGSNYINFLIYHYGLHNPPDSTYLEGLLKNSSFKKRFVERISYYMKNVWTEENIMKVYNYYYNAIEGEMMRNSKRWNQSYDNWKESINTLKKNALSKIESIPKATKEYFSLSDKEYYEYFK